VVDLSQDSKKYGSRHRELSDRYVGVNYQFNPDAPFNDIISHLTWKHGGNVHDLRIVNVTQSSEYDTSGYYAGKNCVNLNSSAYSLTSNQPNRWLSFNFKRIGVKVRHYSIRSRADVGANGRNPRSWLIEVSDDGVSWRDVSRETDNKELNGANLSHTFLISSPTMSRFVRIR
jgi:hypothetical protein